MTSHIKDKVSVVIPAYNEERFLRRTLDSVVNQVDCVLIGDNASTDGTQAICLEFAAKYPHVRYIRHETNIGMAANYNSIYSLVETEFFFHIGAHDIVPSNYVGILKHTLQNSPDAVCAYGNVITIDNNDTPLYVRHFEQPYYKKCKNSSSENDPTQEYDKFCKTNTGEYKSIATALADDNPLERASAYIKAMVLSGILWGLYRSEKALDRYSNWQPINGPDVVIMFDLLLRGKFIHCADTALKRRDNHKRMKNRFMQILDRRDYMMRVAGKDAFFDESLKYQRMINSFSKAILKEKTTALSVFSYRLFNLRLYYSYWEAKILMIPARLLGLNIRNKLYLHQRKLMKDYKPHLIDNSALTNKQLNADSKNSDTVNIVFCTDKNFVVLTIVAITSIIKNKKTDTKLRIFVFANQITENQKQCFNAIDCGEEIKIELINITLNTSLSSFESLPGTNWVTETTWIRYGIYNFLPDLDKILYLDCDVVVLGDLKNLYNVDLGENYVGAVRDIIAELRYGVLQDVGVDEYFNAGVLLCNLKKMRKDATVTKIHEGKQAKSYKHLLDQDIANHVFKNRVVWLPVRCNIIPSSIKYCSCNTLNCFYKTNYVSKRQFLEDALILHLSGKYKPNNYKYTYGRKQWFEYFRMSTVKNEKLEIRSSLLHFIVWRIYLFWEALIVTSLSGKYNISKLIMRLDNAILRIK